MTIGKRRTQIFKKPKVKPFQKGKWTILMGLSQLSAYIINNFDGLALKYDWETNTTPSKCSKKAFTVSQSPDLGKRRHTEI